MRAATLRQSGRVAPFAKTLAEMVVAVRLAGRGDQERQVLGRCGVEHGAQFGIDWNQKLFAGLALLDVQGWPVRSLADVLPPQAHDIAAPLCGVEQQRERKAWLCANWMMRLELRDLVVSPSVKSVALD